MLQLVTFSLDQQLFALPLKEVARVIWIVEITPLANPPPAILGVIQISHNTIPVINTRKVMGLPIKELELSDQLLICNRDQGSIALLVDRTEKVLTISKDIINHINVKNSIVESFTGENNELIFVCSLDQFYKENHS